MKKKIIYLLLLMVVCCIAPQISFAQVLPPDEPVDTPIDGGVSLLIAAGVAYGAKKAHAARSQKSKSNKL